MIKTLEDGSRLIVSIERVDEDAEEKCRKILEILGNPTPEKVARLTPDTLPSLPDTAVKSDVRKVDESKVSAGYKAYLDARNQIRENKLEGDARKETIDKIKRFAESMKTKIPTGENLFFCIVNLEAMFSERILVKVCEEMKMSHSQLLAADDETLTAAYKIAIVA